MRHKLAGVCLIASLLAATAAPTVAEAADAPAEPRALSAEATQAERLFEAERYGDAAPALRSVMSGATGDRLETREHAHYQLAIALYRVRLFHGSFALFAEIASRPDHLRFHEALPWLAKLSIALPEPSEMIERVGKYSSRDLERFNNPAQREIYWELNYLLGRYKYRNGIYDEAIRLLAKVDAKSKRYVEAQLCMGVSYIKIRKARPAIESMQRATRAIEAGP